MELRAYGLGGFGIMVCWLSVEVVYVVCVGVAFVSLKCGLYFVFLYFGIGGSWVVGFPGACTSAYNAYCMLYIV